MLLLHFEKFLVKILFTKMNASEFWKYADYTVTYYKCCCVIHLLQKNN